MIIYDEIQKPDLPHDSSAYLVVVYVVVSGDDVLVGMAVS